MKRRQVLAGFGGVAFASLAGCLGAVGMDEHTASPAGVDPSVRDETGYDRVGVEEIVVTETFELTGYSEEVVVTNYLTEYEKSIDMGPLGSQEAAVFNVLTSPQVSVAGQGFNPIEDMDSRELVDLVAENYDEIENIRQDGEEEVTILDQETMKTRFEADAVFGGQSVEVYVHVTESVQTDGDHLVTIGVYPQEFRGDEEENTVAMMEGVIDDADIDADDADSDTGGDDGDEGGTEDDDDDDNGIL